MKVFRVSFKKNSYNNETVTKTVLAGTIEKAVDNVKRYIKKNMYSSAEITLVELETTIDIVYKS